MATSQGRHLGLARAAAMTLLVLGVGTARPSTAQVDLNGPWGVQLSAPPFLPAGYDCVFDVVQVGPALWLTSSCAIVGPISASGTIDPMTGAFSASGTANGLFCPSLTLTGQAALASDGFDGNFACPGGAISGTFEGSRCGNLVVDAGEDCDGNVDCCSPTCQFSPPGTGCETDGNFCTLDICDGAGTCNSSLAPPGNPCPQDNNQCTDDVCDGAGTCTHPFNSFAPCNDGNDCTGDGVCSGGICSGAPLLPPGSPCGADATSCTPDTCDGAGTCIQGPCSPCCNAFCQPALLPGCKRPTAPVSQVHLRRKGGGNDLLKWKWKAGEQTDVSEFGNPLSSTNYTLCVYGTWPSPPLLLQHDAAIPAGGMCGTKPCWRSDGPLGFTYKDKAATPDGIDLMKLRAGGDGIASIMMKGKGPNLNLAPLYFNPPVTVQLRASNGECWEAEYNIPNRSDQETFKASDGQ